MRGNKRRSLPPRGQNAKPDSKIIKQERRAGKKNGYLGSFKVKIVLRVRSEVTIKEKWPRKNLGDIVTNRTNQNSSIEVQPSKEESRPTFIKMEEHLLSGLNAGKKLRSSRVET